ncbi:MAG TPA: FecR domain-containing protein [Syntrophales bacterium]|nr:FecR domain-containing protein [Syntrophales bacterium]HQB14509.1 FecR domain-containing protein [Syntrophales bacterium]
MIRKLVVLSLIVSLVLPIPLFAAVIGEFAVVTGDVTVTRAGKVIKPQAKDKVETLDLIQTGKNSNARVVLTDASAMALGPNTKLEMKQFNIQGKKTTGLFYVPMGLVQTNVAKALGPGSKFEMQTPTAIAGVRGTAWLTLVEAMVQAGAVGTKSTFYGLAQAISVFNTALPAQVVTVSAGNFTVVTAGVAPTAATAFAPATVSGLTSTLGASAIPGVAAGAAAGTVGAAGAGAAAGSATIAGVGAGTIAAGVVAAAAVVAAVAASTSKTDSTPATTTTHHGTTAHH